MAGCIVVVRTPGSGLRVVRNATGRTGPRGPASPAARYIHTQSSALAEWVVNHNLGSRPVVSVLSTGGVEIEANVVHVSANQVRVLFSAPFSGSAVCI